MSLYRFDTQISHSSIDTASEPSTRTLAKKPNALSRSGKSNMDSGETQKSKSSDRKSQPNLRKTQLRKDAATRQSAKKSLKQSEQSETGTCRSLSWSQSNLSNFSSTRSHSLMNLRLQDSEFQNDLGRIQKAKDIDKSEEISLAEEQRHQPRRTHSLISTNLEKELLDGRRDVEESAEEIVIEEDINGIQYRQQMINVLREIPDIADLSDSSLSSMRDKPKPMSEKSVKKRKQLTINTDYKESDRDGYVTEEESPDTDNQTVNEVGITDATTSSTLSTSMLSFSDIDEKFLPPVQPTTYRLSQEKSQEIQHVIDNMIRQTDDILILDDDEAAEREIYVNMCKQFVDDLIATVVTKYEEDQSALRSKLDKEKLMDALQLLVLELYDQRVKRDQLERMISEHCFRKKKYVYISKVNFFDSLNYARFQKALKQLDKHLELKKLTEIKVKDSVNELREELNERVYYSEQKIEDFENLVRATLVKNKDYQRLNNLITYQLKLMAKLRDDQSDMRLELLCMQHRYADIQLQSEALNDDRNGLKISEFIMQLAETEGLNNKINERNMELSRLHRIVNYNTHALAHIKCKATMIRSQLKGMRIKLGAFERQRLYYRGLSYRAQISHNNMIREINRIRMSSPLMFFPMLLQEYDETLSKLRVQHNRVNKLRMEYNELMQRIRVADRSIHGNAKANIWQHVDLPKEKPLQLIISALSTE